MSVSPDPSRSLSRKVTLPLVVVGTCLAALGVAGIYTVVNSQLESRLRLRAQTIAQAIAYAAENIERHGELPRIVRATGAEREIALLLVAAAVGAAHIRRRRRALGPTALSPAEAERARALLTPGQEPR